MIGPVLFAGSARRNADEVLCNPWLVPFNRTNRPRLRLFCFPYAGGDANVFRAWGRAMPEAVEVIGVQYPGRGAHDAPLIDDCMAMVSQLYDVIRPLLDCDFVFFGHSNGALISFELARALDAQERGRHRHHFLSGRAPAHLGRQRRMLSGLDQEHLVRALYELGGTPDEVLNDASLMNLILPRLRADFRLGERYGYRDGPVLACGATILHGRTDVFVDAASLHRWSELVTGQVRVHTLDGGHFFLHTHQSELLAIVRDRLETLEFPSLTTRTS